MKKTVIAGVGLIGGSLAAAGKRAGILAHVVGVGRSPRNLEAARAAGIVDQITHDLAAAVIDADLVVLAAPVDTCVELLARAAAAAPANCLFTDVASVKTPVVEAAARVGIAERFVGAHPIAGGTRTGAGAADAALFRDRLVVLTPSRESSKRARQRVEELWRAVGAEVCELAASVHDRILALTSHLPQMLASCLCAAAAGAENEDLVRRLAGPGFRDTTRIAQSDAAIWVDIARANRGYLVAEMNRFAESWARLRDAIASGDDDAVRAVLERGAALRKRLGQA